MWKYQALDFAYHRLRGKVGGSVTADSACTILGEHFPMKTLMAEQDARRFVTTFRNIFVDVVNLTPSTFLDQEGNALTGVMYRSPHPLNVCI